MILLFLLAACDGGEIFVTSDVAAVAECAPGEGLATDFETSLDPSGCHFFVSGINADATVLLQLDVPAFVDLSQGTAVNTSYTLPDSGVRLEVQLGCLLDHGLCGAEDTGSPQVDATWTATAGTVAIEGTPVDAGAARATVTFTGVTFGDGAGSEVTVDSLTWTDVALSLEGR